MDNYGGEGGGEGSTPYGFLFSAPYGRSTVSPHMSHHSPPFPPPLYSAKQLSGRTGGEEKATTSCTQLPLHARLGLAVM